ncbi:putative signal peptide protein [Puccinia sorghi]|uniref:Putative signal peptide protein n=1 Tax=Puccinia sorghi TaxID=27349 RepID=A0A0L6UXV6_9BASI|nr:putative signal peptide protein [Puccinia sorghi]
MLHPSNPPVLPTTVFLCFVSLLQLFACVLSLSYILTCNPSCSCLSFMCSCLIFTCRNVVTTCFTDSQSCLFLSQFPVCLLNIHSPSSSDCSNSHFKKNLLNCLQLTCSMLQPICHPNSTSWFNQFLRMFGVTTEASRDFLYFKCRHLSKFSFSVSCSCLGFLSACSTFTCLPVVTVVTPCFHDSQSFLFLSQNLAITICLLLPDVSVACLADNVPVMMIFFIFQLLLIVKVQHPKKSTKQFLLKLTVFKRTTSLTHLEAMSFWSQAERIPMKNHQPPRMQHQEEAEEYQYQRKQLRMLRCFQEFPFQILALGSKGKNINSCLITKFLYPASLVDLCLDYNKKKSKWKDHRSHFKKYSNLLSLMLSSHTLHGTHMQMSKLNLYHIWHFHLSHCCKAIAYTEKKNCGTACITVQYAQLLCIKALLSCSQRKVGVTKEAFWEFLHFNCRQLSKFSLQILDLRFGLIVKGYPMVEGLLIQLQGSKRKKIIIMNMGLKMAYTLMMFPPHLPGWWKGGFNHICSGIPLFSHHYFSIFSDLISLEQAHQGCFHGTFIQVVSLKVVSLNLLVNIIR